MRGLLQLFLLAFMMIAMWGGSESRAAVPYKLGQAIPDFLEFQPYNHPAGFNEHNLWWIEENRIHRSAPLISPDFQGYAFTEVIFIADYRQTVSTLYWVPLPRMPFGPSSSEGLQAPGEDRVYASPADSQLRHPEARPNLNDPRSYTAWFNVEEMQKRRQQVLQVNQGVQRGFSFETLTPVDWNMAGTRLLLKRRAGILYTGLRCTDVLIWDREAGTVSLYLNLLRALEYQWQQRVHDGEAPPRLEKMAWDIEPLGWKEGAEDVIYWRAWAYTEHPEKKRFPLGLWAYHVDAQQTQLISMENNTIPADVAQHGLMPNVVEEKLPSEYVERRYGNFAPRMQPPKQRQVFF